jgi:hypothetical protein
VFEYLLLASPYHWEHSEFKYCNTYEAPTFGDESSATVITVRRIIAYSTLYKLISNFKFRNSAGVYVRMRITDTKVRCLSHVTS